MDPLQQTLVIAAVAAACVTTLIVCAFDYYYRSLHPHKRLRELSRSSPRSSLCRSSRQLTQEISKGYVTH